jgi:hypothetical protein
VHRTLPTSSDPVGGTRQDVVRGDLLGASLGALPAASDEQEHVACEHQSGNQVLGGHENLLRFGNASPLSFEERRMWDSDRLSERLLNVIARQVAIRVTPGTHQAHEIESLLDEMATQKRCLNRIGTVSSSPPRGERLSS